MPLRNFQEEGVEFLRNVRRGILADDMGCGKSAQAISAAISFKTTKRVLIVCPSYVRGVWANKHDGGELAKWASPAVEVYECKGTKPGLAPLHAYDFVICHYDILSRWAKVLQEWSPEVVIFDEAHYLMNPRAQRTAAALLVSSRAEYVWGLTGTPMTNRPRDLWGILSVVVPGRFGGPDDFFRFGLRYCGATKKQVTPDKVVWDFDGRSNLEELRARLSHFMLRRTKSQVALELPAKTRQVIRLDVTRARQCEGNMLVDFHGKGASLRGALAVAADAKLPQAIEIISDLLSQGQKVVATCYRRAVAEHLADALGGVVIHGGVSQAQRERRLHELRASESPPLLCTTIDATSTGIDLSYADVGVLVELTYEPHEILQWEARFHRLTTTSPKLIQFFIARGTTDELIAETVLSKLDALEAVIGGFEETGMAADLREKEEDIMADLYRSLGL